MNSDIVNHALDLSLQEWQELLGSLGEPTFRAKQILSWIYQKKVVEPQGMSNLPSGLRAKLESSLAWKLPVIEDQLEAGDGTTKLLLRSHRNHLIETVIMRYPERTSLCVSSQVGCKLACRFCQTGKLGFFRHLRASEILGQLYRANEILQAENRQVSHVVFMGMGEPLDNYEACVGAANRMIDEDHLNLSARHVTVSTSGIAPKIIQLAQESKAALAVSLHAARDELRSELMPINQRYPLATLKKALCEFQSKSKRKITIEYILIKDVNCSLREAKDLVKFLHGLRAKVNLIPFNAHPGLPYERPSEQEISTFQQYLSQRSIPAPVRYSKGQDVSAACGQLAAKNLNSLTNSPDRAAVANLMR